MGWRGTVALLVVVLITAGFLWFQAPPEPELPENVPNLLGEPRLRDPAKFVPLVAFDPAKVLALDIRHGDRALAAQRQGDGWQASTPGAQIDPFLRALTELGRVVEIPADETMLADYGLKDPQSSVRLTVERQEAPTIVLVGNQNPAGTGVYARVNDSGPVILAGALLTWELDKLFRPALE